MLDIGFPEFLLISFVLLIVVGPKDLPKVLRSITSFARKIKSMASQFHSGIDDLANEAEISDLRKEVNKIDKNSLIEDHVGEIKELEDDINIKSIKNNVDHIKNANNEKIEKNSKSKFLQDWKQMGYKAPFEEKKNIFTTSSCKRVVEIFAFFFFVTLELFGTSESRKKK